MFRTILVADSGQGHVEDMVKMMLNVPGFASGRLNLLHVLVDLGQASLEEHMQSGALLLAQAVRNLGLNPGAVNTILRQGDAKQAVLTVAEEINADLIVMGSRGLGRLQSILANSTSQYVFQLSRRPMLLVRDDLYIRYPNRLLVAVNGSTISQHALRVACELVRGLVEGQLRIVHVGHQAPTPSRGGEQRLNSVLEEAKQIARRLGVEATTEYRSGSAAQQICAAVEENGSNLLVLGSSDRRPTVARSLVDLDKLIGSSISDYVRVKAGCPVLLIRETEATAQEDSTPARDRPR